jgi:hypothetical protein
MSQSARATVGDMQGVFGGIDQDAPRVGHEATQTAGAGGNGDGIPRHRCQARDRAVPTHDDQD